MILCYYFYSYKFTFITVGDEEEQDKWRVSANEEVKRGSDELYTVMDLAIYTDIEAKVYAGELREKECI